MTSARAPAMGKTHRSTTTDVKDSQAIFHQPLPIHLDREETRQMVLLHLQLKLHLRLMVPLPLLIHSVRVEIRRMLQIIVLKGRE